MYREKTIPHLHCNSGGAHHALLFFLIATLFAALVWPVDHLRAQAFSASGDLSEVSKDQPVTVHAQWLKSVASPGDQRVIAIVADIAPTYHINPEQKQIPSDFPFPLIPTTIEVSQGNDIEGGNDQSEAALIFGPIQFPKAEEVTVQFTGEPLVIKAYEHRAVFYIPVIVKDDALVGDYPVRINFGYQTCNDQVCLIPVDQPIDLTLKVVTLADAAAVAGQSGGGEDVSDPVLFAGFNTSVFEQMVSGEVAAHTEVPFDIFGLSFKIDTQGVGFVLLLLVAMVGGFLLNLTPCVLPVIPIKIMSLSQAAGNRAKCLMLGIWMSVGVVGFWLLLGGVIGSVASIKAVNQLFQYPIFTIGVGVVIALLAIGMCGVFSIRLPQWVYQYSPKQETAGGSIGFGVMTAVLSTPCTAPFMGAAAAWALTQSFAVVLLTFGAIGFGMALPYLVLSAMPHLVDKMPRTGPASELVKQVMGLLMLAAAAFFIGVGISALVVQPPDSPSGVYWWIVGGFVALAAIWLIVRTWQITKKPVLRIGWSLAGVAVIVLVWMGTVRLTDKGPIDWVNYTPDRFQGALRDGKVVVMDFTADWCLNCKALEHGVLFTDEVVNELKEKDVVPMKVDITSDKNVAGKEMLEKAGRVTIPLLVVYAPDGKEVFKSDAYTADQVIQAVSQAKGEAVVGLR
ncbi:cytochrome c biogenesis protein CcdA [Poriferisphaera sp. WC338]|uniref:protein-disulfide reductase DsbD family protein n=1 Tax=Poriferisphaera sp. WC338 TaxID=3425129 RepID=UPI003D81A3FE